MVVFIDFLRALATCLITNTHYTGVYPIEALANGGCTGCMFLHGSSPEYTSSLSPTP